MSEQINKVVKFEKRNVPNSAFDIEYRTEWRDEVDFLAERGIYYTIRKKEGEYQIPVYKYTKCADLFIALADFYLRRKRNLRSLATFKGKTEKKPEQQSFVNKDGTLNEKFVVEHPETKKEENVAENKIEPVAETAAPAEIQDDTE